MNEDLETWISPPVKNFPERDWIHATSGEITLDRNKMNSKHIKSKALLLDGNQSAQSKRSTSFQNNSEDSNTDDK